MLVTTIDERTELRLLREQDAECVAAVTGDVSVVDALRWIRGLLDLHRDGKEIPCGVWVAGKMAGYVLLEVHDDGEGLLHYGLVPAYRGKGIATRACAALVEYAFTGLGLRALKSDPSVSNVASCRVAERLGFERVGTVPVHGKDGAAFDVARYRLTAEQWRARESPGDA